MIQLKYARVMINLYPLKYIITIYEIALNDNLAKKNK